MQEDRSIKGAVFRKLLNAAAYILYRPRVKWADKNMKNTLKNDTVIFVCNHIGHKDGAFVGAVLDKYKPYMLVAKDWYEKNGVGSLIKLCRTIPIDRFEADALWYEKSLDCIKSGNSMVIFPEGSTSKDGNMKEFKPGAALLSATTGASIVPLAIHGDYKAIFGKRQQVYIGTPIESKCPEDMRHSLYAKKLIKEAQRNVQALKTALENGTEVNLMPETAEISPELV